MSGLRCPSCNAENDALAEACFTCGRAFDALTQGFVLSDRYEVLRPLGSGGMGRVYEAFDRVLEESVAIKVLRAEFTGDPEVARRFRHEIKLARRISHPRVCRIHEYGETAGFAYISMEFIPGRSLKERLQTRIPAFDEGLGLSLQVAEGLSAIHRHGVVHRDLKSANIMVDPRGDAKILDFGIAKQADGGTALTTGDRIFGTPEYMSPEQVEGGTADARSDLYALGCVVYEIFTGTPPFRGESPYATLLKHLKEPPPLDPAAHPLSPGLRKTLARALAKDRNDRFASAVEFMAALRAAGAEDGAPLVTPASRTSSGSHPETVTVFPLPRRRPRRRWVWAGVGAIVAMGALLLPRGSAPPIAAPRPAEGEKIQEAPRTPPPPLRSPLGTPEPIRRKEAPAPPPKTTAPPPTQSAHEAQELPSPGPAPEASLAPPPSTSAPEPSGTLALMVVPEAEVLVDGASLGVVARRDVALPAGRHQLEVRHPDYLPLPRYFTIRAAETTTLIFDLKEKGIPRAAAQRE